MDKGLFEAKVTQLKGREGADVAAVDGLREWLLAAERGRIHPHQLAADCGIEIGRLLPELLHAVPIGLLDLHWDVRCPHCGSLAEVHQDLAEATLQTHCAACTADFEVDFARLVEVTFALNGELGADVAEDVADAAVPRLTGLELIHYPAFNDLFRDQVLSQRERLQISSVTTLFTDITGSTQMYERLGDAAAYNIVRDHFDVLFSAVAQHGGTVLKTIGDAVMASFVRNDHAIAAVLEALDAFADYNRNREAVRQVHIKIGLHRGPAILVTLNNSLDYFGSSINKAARIQAQAGSNEIWFSQEVYDDPAVRQKLAEAGVSQIEAHQVDLKGIAGQHTVYRTAVGRVMAELAGERRRGLLARLLGR